MPDWNEEHLATIYQGQAVWNAWRAANPYVKPDLEDANLRGLDLSEAQLSNISLIGARMEGVRAEKANFIYARLGGARLQGARLTGADCASAEFTGAQLVEADLQGARLHNCDFRYAQMQGCNLKDADLSGAIFGYTGLSGADIAGCRVKQTVWSGVDFRTLKGVEHLVHQGPSFIDLESLRLSEGHIPDVFLRGVGLGDTVIAYVASLGTKPIQYYSCFISYSSADEEIAKRLFADLQAAGVRCWFAPEDLRIGDKFRQRIDESIRVYEKLLVILSSSSVASPWVESEVEAAFEREHQRGHTVLFPIRSDDTVMTTETAWAAQLRRTRHIGDFRRWKDADGYAVALDRLLRDLRQDGAKKS